LGFIDCGLLIKVWRGGCVVGGEKVVVCGEFFLGDVEVFDVWGFYWCFV